MRYHEHIDLTVLYLVLAEFMKIHGQETGFIIVESHIILPADFLQNFRRQAVFPGIHFLQIHHPGFHNPFLALDPLSGHIQMDRQRKDNIFP